MAALFTSTPHPKMLESTDAPLRSSVMGNNGTRMVFSCTWKENKKKESDELRRAYGRSGRKGGG